MKKIKMCPPGYHHNGFVATYVPKFMSVFQTAVDILQKNMRKYYVLVKLKHSFCNYKVA